MNWLPGRRPDADGDESLPDFVRERPWLRQLYCEPRWLATVGALVLAALAAALWLLPVFPNGPHPGGGLRWLAGRHWYHARRAVGAARAASLVGDAKAAARAWRAAVAHDPECIECERAQLAALLRERPPERLSLTNGTRHGLWLLQLGGTNHADVALFARLLLHHGEAPEAVALMEPTLARFSAAELPVYLEGRLAEHTFGGVGLLWPTLAAEIRRDPVVHLYELAWRIGWGPAGGAPAARRELAGAAKTGPPGIVARLELELSLTTGSAADADDALERLQRSGLDAPPDHVRVARLWRSVGKADRARARLARVPRARSADDALETAALAVTVGDAGIAASVLRDAAPRIDETALWLRWGLLAVDRSDWETAGTVGQRILDGSSSREALLPFAWFLKAISAEKAGREAESTPAFVELVRSGRGDQSVMWMVSGLLVRFGHPREAQPLLAACEATWSGKPEYWEMMHRVASAGDDVEGMLQAARRASELAPGDPVPAARLAAALVALRRDPVEAMRVTLDAESARPGDARISTTRALALIQIGRDDEGLAQLAALEKAARDDPWVRTGVYLGRFEVHCRRGEARAALEAYGKIDSRQLLPPQVLWVEKQFEGIDGGTGSGAAGKPARQP